MKKYESKLDYIKGRYSLENMTHDDMCDLCVEMWNEMIEKNIKEKILSDICYHFHDFGLESDCFACYFYTDGWVYPECDRCEFAIFKNGHGDGIYCENKMSPFYNYSHSWDRCSRENMIEICDLFI